jgi:hypothetical protein
MTSFRRSKAHRRAAPHVAGSSVGFAFYGSGFCSRFAGAKR